MRDIQMAGQMNQREPSGQVYQRHRTQLKRQIIVYMALLILVAGCMALAGCIGMLKITNETPKKPVLTEENRATLLKQIIKEAEKEGQVPAGPEVQSAGYPALAGKLLSQQDSLKIRQEYIYGDLEHEIHASVSNVRLLPFYFWWFIDYNKFVSETPNEGNQFLVVFVRFENNGTKSALVPSAEMLPVVYNDTIYLHRPYFNLSVLSSFQREIYGGANENYRLPYQWIRELGQDQRDYAFLSGYTIIKDNNTSNSTATNTSASSNVTKCTGSITLPTESGKIISKEITEGQCPGFFIKPGESNAIEGYLIYEVPEEIDLKRTYLYGVFNSYSWTRWRLG
jgi:hypothetical protein